MVARYGFTPNAPVGIEIYGTREHFSVRTSGLPNIEIQGVCFGATLAAISPRAEPFNWGNVLWHELAHVFAIQLSDYHVPRWFTEGLSEYETTVRRSEWKREEDTSLYLALQAKRIPAVERMNYAFTHARSGGDMTVAYYASNLLVVYIAEAFGAAKITPMLRAWAQGKRTPEVMATVLGVSPVELDRQFRAWLDAKLSRYRTQFVPNIDARDPTTLRFLQARSLLRKRQGAPAKKAVEALRAQGDGLAVRMLAGDVALAEKNERQAIAEFEAAARFDPSHPEPWRALADLARKRGDGNAELAALRHLAVLDQHDGRVWRRLLSHLVARKQWAEATQIGEGALFVDIHNPETHVLYGEALVGTGNLTKAMFEAETALLCEGQKAPLTSRAQVLLARGYLAQGDRQKARQARDEALRVFPDNVEARGLVVP